MVVQKVRHKPHLAFAKITAPYKGRLKAEQATKLAAMTPEERAARNAKRNEKRRDYQAKWRIRNREKMNAYAREWQKNKRKAQTGITISPIQPA